MSKSGTIITSALVGASAAVLGGIVLELWKEEHAKKKARQSAMLAGALEDARLRELATPGLMPAGYWQTVVDAEAHAEANPLDDAIKSGLVVLEHASGFGFGADKFWLKVWVPRAFKGAAGIALRGWAEWVPATKDLTARQAIQPGQGTETPALVEMTDALNQKARDFGKRVDAIVGSMAQTVALVGGVALVGWLLLASRKGR